MNHTAHFTCITSKGNTTLPLDGNLHDSQESAVREAETLRYRSGDGCFVDVSAVTFVETDPAAGTPLVTAVPRHPAGFAVGSLNVREPGGGFLTGPVYPSADAALVAARPARTANAAPGCVFDVVALTIVDSDLARHAPMEVASHA
ncbi:MAG: hypothetical protein M3017_05610 [Actinomycetota bacterium]|nr:hypothetical protein [Actinomycetota bacterium]